MQAKNKLEFVCVREKQKDQAGPSVSLSPNFFFPFSPEACSQTIIFYGVGSTEKTTTFVKIIMLPFFEDRLFLNTIAWTSKVKK